MFEPQSYLQYNITKVDYTEALGKLVMKSIEGLNDKILHISISSQYVWQTGALN